MTDGRNKPLTIEIVDEQLRISIGIDALMIAVQGGDYWDDETMTVLDPDAFAAEIAHALEHNEEEDGTTDLHLAIDGAVEHLIENGNAAVRVVGDDEEIVYDRDGPR